MKLMLTSFGVGQDLEEPLHIALHGGGAPEDLFYRMPPVGLRSFTRMFTPEYSVFLLADELILDEMTFDRLPRRGPYKLVAETLRALNQEGFIKLHDYSQILRQNEPLFHSMVENDLRSPEQWGEEFLGSVGIWQQFVRTMQAELDEEYPSTRGFRAPRLEFGHVSLPTWSRIAMSEPGYDLHYEDLLRAYLEYVNANIVISTDVADRCFYDWADFQPFYRRKFLSVAQDPPGARVQAASQQLFEVAFPEFAIRSPEQLLRILEDKRVGELRQRIEKAAKENESLDVPFARRVFHEVIKRHAEITRYRKIISYATVPLGFIPWIGPAVQLIGETASAIVAHKLQGEYRWFYMLSDIAESDEVLQ